MNIKNLFKRQAITREPILKDFEKAGNPVARICQRFPEQARQRLAELEAFRGTGFDVQGKYETLEEALGSIGGNVLLGRLTEVGYDMELPPISPYENLSPFNMTHYVALPLPEKSTLERQFYLGQNAYTSENLPFFAYLTEWVLFTAEKMPLRKNERSNNLDIKSLRDMYELLQEYRKNLSD